MHRTNSGIARGLGLFLKVATRTSTREKINAARMQKVFRDRVTAMRLIESAPQFQPYRDTAKIKTLFARNVISVKEIRTLHSCFVVEI